MKSLKKIMSSICITNEISVLPYFSLASGFLSGKYRSESDLSKSARGQGIKKYLNEVAVYNETGPGTVALAWLMTRSTVAAPIASATTIEQLNDLINAANLQLDKDALELLDKASDY